MFQHVMPLLVVTLAMTTSFRIGRRHLRSSNILRRSYSETELEPRTRLSGLGTVNEPHYVHDARNSFYPSKYDMSLTFLGTASCVPTLNRGVSCISFRHGSDIWLFDCGESTQLQIQRSSAVKLSKIKKIFVTHMHGDHIFGLAAVLCQMGSSQRADSRTEPMDVIDIYGPQGIRDYVRAITQLTYSKVIPPHRVHELIGLKDMHGNSPFSVGFQTRSGAFKSNEMSGSRDILPEKDGRYVLVDEKESNGLQVFAGSMSHTVPCVGYVVVENDKPGGLKVDLVEKAVNQNKEKLNDIYGDHFRVYKKLKSLLGDEVYTFPDGTEVSAAAIHHPTIRGRKFVIMGDTRSGDGIRRLAQNADVVVHEATNAWVEGDEETNDTSPEGLMRATRAKGHSTPEMAGIFAKKINATQLVLTHFSNRYNGDTSPESLQTMKQIENLAADSAGFDRDSGRVIAAYDFMRIDLPPHKELSWQ